MVDQLVGIIVSSSFAWVSAALLSEDSWHPQEEEHPRPILCSLQGPPSPLSPSPQSSPNIKSLRYLRCSSSIFLDISLGCGVLFISDVVSYLGQDRLDYFTTEESSKSDPPRGHVSLKEVASAEVPRRQPVLKKKRDE